MKGLFNVKATALLLASASIINAANTHDSVPRLDRLAAKTCAALIAQTDDFDDVRMPYEDATLFAQGLIKQALCDAQFVPLVAVTADEPVALLPDSEGTTSIAWNAPGDKILSANHIWTQNQDGSYTRIPTGSRAQAKSLAWKIDETQFAVGTFKGLHLYTQQPNGSYIGTPLLGHTNTVTELAWNHDGSKLASACPLDGTIKIWMPNQRDSQSSIPLIDIKKKARALAWNCHDQLATAANEGVDIWTPDQNGSYLNMHFDANCNFNCPVAWNADGTKLAVVEKNNTVSILTLNPDKLTDKISLIGPSNSSIQSIVYHPHDNKLAYDRYVVDQGSKIVILNPRHNNQYDNIELNYNPITIKQIAWSPDGHRLASSSAWDGVKIWAMPHSLSLKQAIAALGVYKAKQKQDAQYTQKVLDFLPTAFADNTNTAIQNSMTAQLQALIPG